VFYNIHRHVRFSFVTLTLVDTFVLVTLCLIDSLHKQVRAHCSCQPYCFSCHPIFEMFLHWSQSPG